MTVQTRAENSISYKDIKSGGVAPLSQLIDSCELTFSFLVLLLI